MKRAFCKLRARRGVTLSELLVALLILSLVGLGASVGISSAVKVYHQSVTLSDAQMLSSTLSGAVMDELRSARDIRIGTGDKLISFTSQTYGEGVSFSRNQEGRVTLGGVVLAGTGIYSGDLTASLDITYSGGSFAVELQVFSGGQLLRTVNFSVRPLNP